MNDLPKRPKFYLHRSRRFWGGLVFLLVLTSWMFATCHVPFRLTVGKWTSFSGWRGTQQNGAGISMQDGGMVLFFEHCNPGHPEFGSPTDWQVDYQQIDRSNSEFHYGFIPEYSNTSTSWETSGEVFVPIWVIIILWTILWPLWIRRGDRKEEERFRKLLGHEE